MKIAKILMAASALCAATASSAHDNRENFGVMDALSICKDLIANTDAGKAGLMEHGWTVPKETDFGAAYSKPGMLALTRDKAVITFIYGKHTDVNGEMDLKQGLCQMYFPGDSVVAATKIAQNLNVPASSFVQSTPHGDNSVEFITETYMLEVASQNDDNTMMRLQYAQK